jgi:hypothetical protein
MTAAIEPSLIGNRFMNFFSSVKFTEPQSQLSRYPGPISGTAAPLLTKIAAYCKTQNMCRCTLFATTLSARIAEL